jgi:uncharacterized delta-60 repeat protein
MNKLFLLLLCCVCMFKANSQAGGLDSTFGNKGIQTTAFYNYNNTFIEQGRVVLTNTNGDIFVLALVNYSYTRIAKYLPDGRLDSSYGNGGYSNAANLSVKSATFQGGKIVVAGNTYNFIAGGYDFAVARYTANGKLDTSFGVNGIIITDFNNFSDDQSNAITLQGDKIIVAGSTGDMNGNTDIALARYTTDGTLDASFGVNGKVITAAGDSSSNANAIALQGNKFVVTGYTSASNRNNANIALARYTADGNLDSSFGVNGLVVTDFINSSNDFANSIVRQDGKIIVAGFSFNYDIGNADFALARYTADGTLDTSFGVNGKVTTDFNNSNDYATSMVLQGDKILLGGQTYNAFPFSENLALTRYTADGILDTSFGVNGKVTADFITPSDVANSIALQGDKIIAVGSVFNSVAGNNDFALTRYTSEGALDASFGVDGLLTGYFYESQITFRSTVIQGSKIIAAGYALNNYNNDFALVRYTTDGRQDSTFGRDGIVTTDFNISRDEAYSVVLQGDKIIVAGLAGNYPNYGFALARYTTDGVLDSSFGVKGKVITVFANSFSFVTSIVLQGDKILVAGLAGNYPDYDFALARYTADGTLDSSFGENGKVTTDFNNSVDVATSIALQGDKIIVGGYTGDVIPNFDIALARYTANGSLDPSFGVNGKVTTDFNNSIDVVTSIALQGNKILVAGNTGDSGSEDFMLVRYTSEGALDASFGENGKVTTDFNNSSDQAISIALQGDKIILGGYTRNPDTYIYDFALARYTAEGVLDASFGMNGRVITGLDGNALMQSIAVHQNRLYTVGWLYPAGTDERYGAIAAYQLETPEPTVSIEDVTVSESKRLAVVTARLSKPTTKLVQVHFTTRDKTATAPQDYIGISGPLFFIPGVNTTFKLYIPIINDNNCEGTEQFEVVLTKAHNATIQDSIGIVTIEDDDCCLTTKQESTSLYITASPNPSAGIFTVQLQGSDVKQQVSIRVYDITGRLVEVRERHNIGQILHLGDQYKAGTYIIEAEQGGRRVQTKVIKTGK